MPRVSLACELCAFIRTRKHLWCMSLTVVLRVYVVNADREVQYDPTTSMALSLETARTSRIQFRAREKTISVEYMTSCRLLFFAGTSWTLKFRMWMQDEARSIPTTARFELCRVNLTQYCQVLAQFGRWRVNLGDKLMFIREKIVDR